MYKGRDLEGNPSTRIPLLVPLLTTSFYFVINILPSVMQSYTNSSCSEEVVSDVGFPTQGSPVGQGGLGEITRCIRHAGKAAVLQSPVLFPESHLGCPGPLFVCYPLGHFKQIFSSD